MSPRPGLRHLERKGVSSWINPGPHDVWVSYERQANGSIDLVAVERIEAIGQGSELVVLEKSRILDALDVWRVCEWIVNPSELSPVFELRSGEPTRSSSHLEGVS